MDRLTPVPRSSYKCARSTSRGQSVRMSAVKFCTMHHPLARMQIGAIEALRLNAGQRHLVVKVQYLNFFPADFSQRNNPFGADLWVYYALSRGQVIRTENRSHSSLHLKARGHQQYSPESHVSILLGSPFQKPMSAIQVL